MTDRWLLSFDNVRNNFLVLQAHGKAAQTIGHHINRVLYISFIEGVHLIQQGRATIVGDDFKIIQEAYQRMNKLSLITYERLKILGFILRESEQTSQELQVYKPDSHFRRSSPPQPYASLIHAFAGDQIPIPWETETKIFCIYDGFSQLLLKSTWIDLSPLDPETGL